jgi:N6-L-threonylcarbamoyladenine synthase
MLILGIETSCDETAASLLEIRSGDIKVLSNVISSQVKLHAKYGGVVPSLAAREHVRNINHVLKLALGRVKPDDIDLIAVTRGPGLVSSLLVGTAFAKTLAWKLKKPIVGANHLEGHIYSNWLGPADNNGKIKTNDKSLFPALCLIVSGGHTELVLMRGHGKYQIVGPTLDDAAGEAFDKIARILGLGYPGGPAISKIAEKAKPGEFKLPRPMLNSKNYDFSFAGLKTAVLYLVRGLTKDSNRLDSSTKASIALEAQQSIVDVLVTKTIRAAIKYEAKSIMLSGGVSANKLSRTELEKSAKQAGIKFFRPEMEYTTDNAAMIALAGYFNWMKKSRHQDGISRKIPQSWKSIRTDANLSL